jgi:hypothetical protein
MFGSAITGSAREIADAFRTFQAAGFTQLEFMLAQQNVGSRHRVGRRWPH